MKGSITSLGGNWVRRWLTVVATASAFAVACTEVAPPPPLDLASGDAGDATAVDGDAVASKDTLPDGTLDPGAADASAPSDANAGADGGGDGGLDAAADSGDGGDAGDTDVPSRVDAFDPCPAAPVLHHVNALVDDEGVITGLVAAPNAASGTIGFRFQSGELTALDSLQQELWSTDVGEGTLFGSFDFDEDGWPDVGVARSEPTEEICGETPVGESHIAFVRGADGSVLTPMVPEKDICWEFETDTYPTTQWTSLSVLFGEGLSTVAVVPYYASTGWFFSWDDDVMSLSSFHFPSTAAFDGYSAAKPNLWDTGAAFVENSHIANGLIVSMGDQPARLVFFTSGRVVQYEVGASADAQLIFDHPFITGDRKDLAGRNYGLVARDPSYPQQIALIAGTDTWSVYLDLITGEMNHDEWGQIERHVALYNIGSDELDDRFYSNAHDNNDAFKYEGRVVYPASPFVPNEQTIPSRVAYNVYEQGHWVLHISEHGTTEDALVLSGLFLWDIRDLDGNGTKEWVISPTEDADDPDVPGYYFPKWETRLYQWNEETASLEVAYIFDDRVPLLHPMFRQPDRSTTRGALYPTLTTADGCTVLFGTRTLSGTNEWVELP